MKSYLLLIVFIVLVGCSQEPSRTIPFIAYDMEDVFLQDFTHKIRDAMQEDFTLEVHDSKANQLIQNRLFVEAIEKKPPFIIVNPVERLSAYTMIDLAKKHDVPIIFINREPLEEDLNRYSQTYYVGADAKQSANIQASLAMELIQDTNLFSQLDKNNDGIIQIAILMGQQGHQDAEQRTQYVIEYLEEYEESIEILAIRVANFSQDDAYTQTKILLDDFGIDVEMILANNDAMAIGAIEALIDEGLLPRESVDIERDHWIPVIGIDGLDVARDYIETNHMYASVLNDIDAMALAIAELSRGLYYGQDLDNLSYPITNGHYVWIDYQRLTIQD